jgi:polyphosphate kinase 2 (PPK2 family)
MASAVKVKSGFALAELDLDRRLKDEMSYQQKLRKLQIAMLELEEIYRVERRRAIIALEGWDASGKSGAIQRLSEKLDPRWIQVWSIGRPTAEEQARHYLWRLAEVAASGQYRGLRPNLVRASAGGTGRRPGPPEGVAAGL